MMQTSVKMKIFASDLKKFSAKKKKATLYRVGAATRLAATRAIRRSKKPSLPGEPPRAHTDKFKHSVNFSVGQSNMVVGYIKFPNSRRNNKKQTVPNVLEFGGTGINSYNPAWRMFSGRNYTNYPVSNEKSALVRYFMWLGWGPIRIGESRDALIQTAKRSRGAGNYRNLRRVFGRRPYKTFKKFSQLKGKYFYIQFANINARETRGQLKQAVKAADLMIKYYGYPYRGNKNRFARPNIAPAFERVFDKTLPKILKTPV